VSVLVTVDSNANQAFPVGTVITIEQAGAGVVTISPAAGVTLNAYLGGLNTAGQYAGVQLIQVATDVWTVFGGV